MSFQAVHWALHEVKGVSMGHKLLLVTLGEYADDTDCAWPSQETLAGVLECSVSTIRRSLKVLVSWGLIDREDRWVMDEEGNTHRATNVYRLHVGAQPSQGGDDVQQGPSGTPEPGDVSAGQAIPVNLTGMGAGGTQTSVDNSSDERVSVANTDTGQSDRYGTYTGQNRGAYRSSMVTGISTPNHQKRTTRPDQTDPVSSLRVDLGSGSGRVRSGRGAVVSASGAARARPQASPAATDRRPVPPASSSRGAGGHSGRGGPSRQPGSSQSAAELPAAVVELLGDCLPDSMLDGLDPEGALRIAQLLRERLDAGWEPRQIRKALDQNLPAKVSRLSGLVASRLRSNVDPLLAPNKVRADAERRRREAAQRRSDAIAAPDRPQHDPALEAALTQVRQRMPGASWPEQVEAAWKIVNDSSTDVPKEAP